MRSASEIENPSNPGSSGSRNEVISTRNTTRTNNCVADLQAIVVLERLVAVSSLLLQVRLAVLAMEVRLAMPTSQYKYYEVLV